MHVELLSESLTLTFSQDATTNPALILAAAGKPGYARLIDTAVKAGKEASTDIDVQVEKALDRLVRVSHVSHPQPSCIVGG